MPTANYITGPTYLLNWGITTTDKVNFSRVRAEAIAFTEMILRLGRTPRRSCAATRLRVAALLAVGRGARRGLGRLRPAAAVTQPPQPTSGPGGSDYPHRGWRVSSGGSGADAWYVFEPARPRPKRAPLAIVMHGYYEFSGYDQMYELIRHTVRKGNVVIYPRWQTDVASRAPARSTSSRACTSAVNGIRGGLVVPAGEASRVQPQLGRTSYFGFSFGGIITANLANRYRSLHLPKPRAIFLDDPHDGGLTGFDEPAVDDSLAGIPSTVKLAVPLGRRRRHRRAGQGGRQLQRDLPEARAHPGARTRTSCSPTPTRTAPRRCPPSTACARAKGRPTPTTGTSAGRSGTRCAAAPTAAASAATRWATRREHRSNGRWSDGVAGRAR